MAAKPMEYQRLPGRGIRRQGFLSSAFIARRVRLWLGQNHLLSVESQWYTEHYRRFYFRDIQAVIIRKTNNGKITNLVLGILAVLSFIAGGYTSFGWQYFWIIMLGVFLFFLLLNTFYGPTSVCHLRTAVQTEEMPSLRRLRRARRVLARVRPLITAAQGQMMPEEIRSRMAQSGGSSAATGSETTSPATTPSPAATPPPE